MDFRSSDVSLWKNSLDAYSTRIQSLNKPNLVSLDDFYRVELPSLIHQRNPDPHITTLELSKLMQWKLSRGKWRPRLLDFVSSLDESHVKSASQKAFESLPDVSKAVSALTVLKGVGPATASAVLAAYAPDVAPFMSDEAMEAVLGNSKEYTLKQYLLFVDKLQTKSKEIDELSKTANMKFRRWEICGDINGVSSLPSFVSLPYFYIERALWSSAVGAKLLALQPDPDSKKDNTARDIKRKRKR
ncbi:hypothetical protein OIU84_013042 [Salix udensis]|uniref:Uncharacterized protein n=1 Tax=Salix udensis TaxID=889485 RepID=A0AAD6JGZ7_9ROSI|nr:hypothetical protein OIU84_013042 [Salix udensis]